MHRTKVRIVGTLPLDEIDLLIIENVGNPDAARMLVSARTGEGIDAFRQSLIDLPDRAKAAA